MGALASGPGLTSLIKWGIKMVKHCECDHEGILVAPSSWYDSVLELPFVVHAPNQCKCQNNLKLYNRNGKKLWLCSICWLPTDIKEPVQ